MGSLFYRPNARHDDAVAAGIVDARYLTSKYFEGPEDIEPGEYSAVYVLASDDKAERIRDVYEALGVDVVVLMPELEPVGERVVHVQPEEWPLRMPPRVYAARFPNGPHADLARSLIYGVDG